MNKKRLAAIVVTLVGVIVLVLLIAVHLGRKTQVEPQVGTAHAPASSTSEPASLEAPPQSPEPSTQPMAVADLPQPAVDSEDRLIHSTVEPLEHTPTRGPASMWDRDRAGGGNSG